MIINDNDITSKINLIAQNIPDDFSALEKIRWLYLKLGQVFCYDYSIMTEDRSALHAQYEDGNFQNVGRYQTCIQISEILALMINNANIACEAKLVDRGLPGVNYAQNHVAVDLTMPDQTKYLLDLTLDLYLIQSGCQTNEFGYTTDRYNTYEIIALEDIKTIDQKIGLLSGDIYTDQRNKQIKEQMENIEYPFENEKAKLELKLDMMAKNLVPTFFGAHEGKRYIDKLMFEILMPKETARLKSYNLFFQDINYLFLVTCYIFKNDGEYLCYLYDNRVGLISTTPEKLDNMMENGWRTNSNSFKDVLYDMINPPKLTN